MRPYNELDYAEKTQTVLDDLPPVREQKIHYTESGDFPGTPIIISLAADASVDEEFIREFTENLWLSFDVFEAEEEPGVGEHQELVYLLEQAEELMEQTWDLDRYPAGTIARHVKAALQLASLWLEDMEDLEEGIEEDPVPDSEGVLFIAFQIDEAVAEEIPRPYELEFTVDPWISQGSSHSYAASGEPRVVTTVFCSQGQVAPDLTGDAIAMGVLHASPGSPVSLRSGLHDARLYVRGVASRSRYTVTGRLRRA